MYEGGYAVIPYVLPGHYVTYAFSFTGGALTNWFITTLAGDARQQAQAEGSSVFEVLEAGMKNGPTGILVLPHFAGAATPYMDPGAMGAIVGLDVSTSASDIYKAVMEGVAYESRVNIERMEAGGIRIDTLRAAGGGAASDVWLQIKADILGKRIVSLGDAEAGVIAGIMLTGVAIGAYSSLQRAADVLVKEKKAFEPRPDSQKAYDELYEKYKRLYPAVRPLV
jgi:xylulokinase